MAAPSGESLVSFVNSLNRKIEKKTEKGGSKKRKRKSVRRKPQGGARTGNCVPDIPLSPKHLNAFGAALGKFKAGKRHGKWVYYKDGIPTGSYIVYRKGASRRGKSVY